jgi:hypothetical protein
MTKRKVEFILASVLIIFLVLHSVYALTGSIGNARMLLYPEVNGFSIKTIEKTILVKNINNVSVNITLSPDKQGEEFLEVIDNSFVLEPETEKKAKFLVKVRKEGTYEGKIHVFFSPIDTKEPGVVLSSTIIVIAKKDQNYEEINYNEIDEEENNTSTILGRITDTDENGNFSKSLLFLIFSTIISLILLGYLIFLMTKKTKSKNLMTKKTKSKNNEK